MQLLVLSDSHGMKSALARFEAYAQTVRPDVVIHLGDHADDLRGASLPCPLMAVRGNCDLFSAAPLLRRERFDGVETMLCHGHLYGVKGGLDTLCRQAKHLGAALVLFGHTHQSLIRQQDGLWLVNPGAAMDAQYPSCASIRLREGRVEDADLIAF